MNRERLVEWLENINDALDMALSVMVPALICLLTAGGLWVWLLGWPMSLWEATVLLAGSLAVGLIYATRPLGED